MIRILFLLVLFALPARAQDIERGRYMAIIGDCVACHTAQGGAPFAGGRPIATPFGTLLTPNITPDKDTGIGGWTDAEFVRALQYGIGRDGRHLYPALPYPYYTRASRDDLLSIRAWLATLKPVHNQVTANQLRFPYDIRLGMLAWNALYFTPGPLAPVAGKSAEWNRGAYLVEGLGHCGACHTPKTRLGGDISDRRLQGDAVQGWFAPALDSDPRTGLGAWSVDDIVEYLATGRNARAAAGGPMGEVVANSTAHMHQDDLRAIAVYLKDQPAPKNAPPAPLAGSSALMRAGGAIYQDNCSACHTPNGAGVARLFPALRGNALVQSDDPTGSLHAVLHGARAVATDAAPTGPGMAGLAWKLDDAQTAAVVTYIRNAWGNAAAPVSAEAARAVRQTR